MLLHCSTSDTRHMTAKRHKYHRMLDTNECNQLHITLINHEFPINQIGVKTSRTWFVRVNRRVLQNVKTYNFRK